MGLDMTVLARPAAGHEAEFEEIFVTLNIADGLLPDPALEGKGFLARLFAARPAVDRDGLIKRSEAISEEPAVTLGAPVVGRDAEADAWVRAAHGRGELTGTWDSADAALAGLDGTPVLAALPDCDGFPVYCNGGLYGGVDMTSFRGQVLRTCRGVLDRPLIDRAWKPMRAGELGDWGAALSEAAATAAREGGHQAVLGRREPVPDPTDPAAPVHIADQAARWAQFWSARGHGSVPYF